MRWLFVGLLLFGLAFGAVMLALPGGAGDAPGWVRWLGHRLSGQAPRVTGFADGSTLLIVPGGGGEAQAVIGAEGGQQVRILTLALIEGSGPVRAIHRCTPFPGATCDDRPEVLCLGRRHPACEQDEVGATGSFSIGPGGGSLRIIAAEAARVRIER